MVPITLSGVFASNVNVPACGGVPGQLIATTILLAVRETVLRLQPESSAP